MPLQCGKQCFVDEKSAAHSVCVIWQENTPSEKHSGVLDLGFHLMSQTGIFYRIIEVPGYPLLGTGTHLVSENGLSLGIVTEDAWSL